MKPRDEIKIVETARGAYAFDARTGRSFSLNGLGLAIWNGLKAGHSTSQITATLASRFANVPSAVIADDVGKFVTQLAERDLISA